MKKVAMLVLLATAPAAAGDDMCCGARNTFWGVNRWPSVVQARYEYRLCDAEMNAFMERERYNLNRTTAAVPQYHLLTNRAPDLSAYALPSVAAPTMPTREAPTPRPEPPTPRLEPPTPRPENRPNP